MNNKVIGEILISEAKLIVFAGCTTRCTRVAHSRILHMAFLTYEPNDIVVRQDEIRIGDKRIFFMRKSDLDLKSRGLGAFELYHCK